MAVITDDLGREITHDIEVVYVAGPYTASKARGTTEEDHVRFAHLTGNDLIDLGFIPLIPHNSHYLHLMKERPYDVWMDIDQLLIERCDALYRMKAPSSGADEEVRVCERGYSERLKRTLPRTVYVFFTYASLVAARDGYRAQAAGVRP